MTVTEFQQWLNAHGASIAVDGKGGPATRAAILQVFTNKSAPAITETELRSISAFLGDPLGKRLRAVAQVEASGAGWFDSGLPKILYERHYFWRLTEGRYGVTDWSNPKAGGYTIDANGNDVIDSWEKLAFAACKDPMAAFSSVSMGKFQIMGAHWHKLGYKSPVEMMWEARRSEVAQYDMVARYIHEFGLRDEFLAMSPNPDDCRAFAKGYNGSGYEKFKYHEKLARWMR